MPLRAAHRNTAPAFEPVLLRQALRALETRHAGEGLMERAGHAAADVAARLARGHAPVVVLCGPGNNGGDGFVAARVLHERLFDVVAVFAGDPAALPAEARSAHAAYAAGGGRIVKKPPPGPAALVIDALFGVGLTRPLAGRDAQWVAWINAAQAPCLALDIPSGVDADTGSIHACAVRATHTATFLAWKPGLLTGEGLDCTGEVSLHRLGTDAAGEPLVVGDRLAWPPPATWLPVVLERRKRNAHKGSFGTLLIAGGAQGMVGAALLAGRGALACGAGKVMLELFATDAPSVDPCTPELMLRRLGDALPQASACVAGPGLGQGDAARARLATLLGEATPLLLDADALNLVAADPVLQARVRGRSAATLLTPHPAEAARLLACSTEDVQRDRLRAARTLADTLRSHVVVKGAGSVIAHPGGAFAINATGNPALASGGSGDVLSGMAGALLAQGVAPAKALALAVCVHGAAADALVAAGVGPIGVRASELAPVVRRLLNGLQSAA